MILHDNHYDGVPIIIPSCTPSNLQACLKALRDYHEGSRPIILVDSSGKRSEMDDILLEHYAGGHGDCAHLYYPDEPFNFSKACNMAIKQTFEYTKARAIFLLNDDAELITPYGITKMLPWLDAQAGRAIISTAVRGIASGSSQPVRATDAVLLREPYYLAFVSVLIGREVFEAVGFLDEAYDGYGQEDVEFCLRARTAGMDILTYTPVVFKHDGSLPSTYRNLPNIHELVERARRVTLRKQNVAFTEGHWDGPPPK